jgi:hypothetical protein
MGYALPRIKGFPEVVLLTAVMSGMCLGVFKSRVGAAKGGRGALRFEYFGAASEDDMIVGLLARHVSLVELSQ